MNLKVGDKVLLVGLAEGTEVHGEVNDGVIKLTKDLVLEVIGEGKSYFETINGCIVFIFDVKVGDGKTNEETTPTDPVDPNPTTPTDPTLDDPTEIDHNPTEDEPIVIEPAKKGCASGAIQSIYSIIMVLGLAFIFKKRFS